MFALTGVPEIVAVPSWLSTKLTVLDSEPTSLNAGDGAPVVVTLKVPVEPTANVVLTALVIPGA